MTTASTTSLAVTDLGAGDTGPTLLFIPGWCGDRTVFDAVGSLASEQRRVLTVDLPDHGESPGCNDASTPTTVDRLIHTMAALGIERVVPVSLSHAGWFAVELRRRLGSTAVPAVVLLDWMVLGTPPEFAEALNGLQSAAWADVRAGLITMWTDGVDLAPVRDYVASMSEYGERHWQRAGREIAGGFAASPVPLDALAALQPCPVLHLYAQPGDDAVLHAQQEYADAHPWFAVERLDARSHFPTLEAPEVVAARIDAFVRGLS